MCMATLKSDCIALLHCTQRGRSLDILNKQAVHQNALPLPDFEPLALSFNFKHNGGETLVLPVLLLKENMFYLFPLSSANNDTSVFAVENAEPAHL